ncbi:MAG TPA: Lrp/AsnC family transcriptional regulator, partial [Ramlibacter sp.]
DRRALGEPICVFAEVALKDQRQPVVQRFEKKMATAPEVVACHVISGRYDYLVRIACPHLENYHRLISAWLDDPALGIEKIVTNIELQTIREFAGFPVPRPPRRH